MPNTHPSITDAELIKELENSFIEAEQKQELINLIPVLANEDRAELLQLIERSKQEKEKADTEYEKGMSEANEKYIHDLEEFTKNEIETARKEKEAEEKTQSTEELKELEGEINEMGTAKKTGNITSTQIQAIPKKNNFKKILFILFIITIIAVAAVIAIQFI